MKGKGIFNLGIRRKTILTDDQLGDLKKDLREDVEREAERREKDRKN